MGSKTDIITLNLTESQIRKVKRILGVEYKIFEISAKEISTVRGSIIDSINPKKIRLRLNKEQIEILKKVDPRPLKSISIDRDIAHKMYGVESKKNYKEISEGLKEYLDDI